MSSLTEVSCTSLWNQLIFGLQAVELATWAPNSANAPTCYFYVVLDGNTIKAIIKAIADASQASMNYNRAAREQGNDL